MSFNKSILQNNTFRQIKRWFRFSSSLKRFKKYMPRHECENKRDFALAFRSSKNEQRRDKIDPYFLIRTDTTLLNVRCFWKRCSFFFLALSKRPLVQHWFRTLLSNQATRGLVIFSYGKSLKHPLWWVKGNIG